MGAAAWTRSDLLAATPAEVQRITSLSRMEAAGPRRSSRRKGALARRLFEVEFFPRIPDRMLVNASFCYDTDSLADALVRFLGKLHLLGNGSLTQRNPPLSREQLLEEDTVFKCAPGVVIMNGIDRFFTTEGLPLSVEFDQLLRKLAQSDKGSGDLRFALLGTERVRRYFEKIGGCDIRDVKPSTELDASGRVVEVTNRYLASLAAALPQPRLAATARIAAAEASGTSSHAYRQAVVGTILDPVSLRTIGVEPELALEILRTLAFIGMPVEAVVLLHAPSIREPLLKRAATTALASGRGKVEDLAAAELAGILDKLAVTRIVIEFTPFGDYPSSEDTMATRSGAASAYTEPS